MTMNDLFVRASKQSLQKIVDADFYGPNIVLWGRVSSFVAYLP